MEINKSLLSYTINKKTELARQDNINSNQNNVLLVDTVNISKVNYIDTINTFDVNSIGSNVNEATLVKYNTPIEPTTKIQYSTTYKDFSPAEISKIKRLIYEYENNKTKPTPPATDPTDPIHPDTPTVDKKSFINDFCDADTMFGYLSTINPNITKESGITRTQLTRITQRDDWEDSNNDFFGTLNHIFDELDKDTNDKLSYQEVVDFIGNEIGDSASAYISKVNSYSNQIQQQWQNLSSQKKLEFALAKTEEYFECMGMTDQLKALARLTGGRYANKYYNASTMAGADVDKFNTIKVGQIAIASLNGNNYTGSITLGCYTYSMYSANDPTYNVGVWATDEDDEDNDNGITLDISLLNGYSGKTAMWYELVDTLVHEITHATAYQAYEMDTEYFGQEIPCPTIEVINKLGNIGALSNTEKQYYIDNYEAIRENWLESLNVNSRVSLTEKNRKLFYLINCLSGEYSAYQADADYVDSIGGDVLDHYMTTAVSGSNEKTTIEQHISTYYDSDSTLKEPKPDSDWWVTYGKNNSIIA